VKRDKAMFFLWAFESFERWWFDHWILGLLCIAMIGIIINLQFWDKSGVNFNTAIFGYVFCGCLGLQSMWCGFKIWVKKAYPHTVLGGGAHSHVSMISAVLSALSTKLQQEEGQTPGKNPGTIGAGGQEIMAPTTTGRKRRPLQHRWKFGVGEPQLIGNAYKFV